MIRNYLKTAFRNLVKNKAHSFINIGGLSVGMAVAMLIGLWIWNEMSFDKSYENHDRIARIIQNINNNGEKDTWTSTPFPLAATLRRDFASDFKYVAVASGNGKHILSVGENNISSRGVYIEPSGPDILSLKMLKGSRTGLNDPSSILIAKSTAIIFFGQTDPLNKVIKIDNKTDLKVTGIYEDLPQNSSFADLSFMAPWAQLAKDDGLDKATNPWRCNCYITYAQVNAGADMNSVSARIKDVKMKNIREEELKNKPQLFLHPMNKWHLYSEFKNGVNTGGRIQYVWLFGIIGTFVLLLACINFMNLSTARSEKRAREVGIRKVVGSLRQQLVWQFFSESFLVTFIAFLFSLLLIDLVLPFFNQLADKKINILWNNPLFWLIAISFCFITGLVAGSYPALYLSSFKPIKVLKGTFKVGRFASIPRKVLVVLQFSVSVILAIGTIVVFNQIQFARNRPIGYNRNGLLTIPMSTTDIHAHFGAVESEMVNTGTVSSITESGSPLTGIWSSNAGFDWPGKDPGLGVDFPNIEVSYDYGKTLGWQFKEGRDFSKSFATDSSAFVINETAVKYMGLKNPVGETIKLDDKPFKVIGVIKDVIMESPYEPVSPTFYHLSTQPGNFVILRINPNVSAGQSLAAIEPVFKKYNPAQPFEYRFADAEYAKKFSDEERVGKLAGFFAGLAIFISCLGLFGMASFMAEQRIKEIGVRKVLGASVFNLWRLLSKDFIMLVGLALLIAVPVGYYFMHEWLQNYRYHAGISWWIFIAAGSGAILITLLTVSYQSIKAALANPIKSLKAE